MRNEGLEHPDITYCMEFGYPPDRKSNTAYEDEYYYSPRPLVTKKRLLLKRLPVKQQTLKIINKLNARTAAMMTARLAYTRENIEVSVEMPNNVKIKLEA